MTVTTELYRTVRGMCTLPYTDLGWCCACALYEHSQNTRKKCVILLAFPALSLLYTG